MTAVGRERMKGLLSRRSRKSSFSQNHQRSWLWGRHAVSEALKAQQWPILECVISDSVEPSLQQALTTQCQQQQVPYRLETDQRLQELTKAPDHQGLIARMGPYPYRDLDALLSALPQQILLLDRIQDAFNYGSLIRCAVQLGFRAILVGEKSQSPVSPHVARASAGAIHYAEIYQHSSLPAAVESLQQKQYSLIGTRMENATDLTAMAFPQQTILAIGSEAHGLAEELTALCDHLIRIPTTQCVDSLNAAVAGGIVMYEYSRQHPPMVPKTT